MEYFKLLQLDREPFSNSPDPDYFFHSQQHLGCLQKLELALRLKRGLNVVIGNVGTGKTTLCRHLIRKFKDEPDFESHLILDPSFTTPLDFLKVIYELICRQHPYNDQREVDIKESIKQNLFLKGVEQNKTVVLIIDEGQKISNSCVEILRELLNYETNTYKLLQIVIFAQLEFETILDNHSNFADRMNLLHYLAPMNFSDTRQMVQHRIKLSSTTAKPKNIFTLPAMWAIYLNSRGYPRKIIHLCHQSMLAMIIQNRSRAGWRLIQSCKNRIRPSGNFRRRLILGGFMAMVIVLVIVGYPPTLIFQKQENVPEPAFKIETPETPVIQAQPETTLPETPSTETPSPVTVQATELVQPKSMTTETDASTHLVAISQLDDYKTPIPASPPEPPQTFSTFQNPPELLGKLIVKPGDTMFGLVYLVYGTRRNSYLREVISMNPHIQDPNNIDIGYIINFPPLPFKMKTNDHEKHWIILDESQGLPGATQRLYEIHKETQVLARLIPNWSLQSGLRFQIAVKGYFTKEEQADSYLKALPVKMAGGAQVVSGWPEDTILYSDPYAGGVR